MFRPKLWLLVCTTPTGQEMSGVVRMMGVEEFQRRTAKESPSSVTTSVSPLKPRPQILSLLVGITHTGVGTNGAVKTMDVVEIS